MDSIWDGMYKKDKYTRERIIKSARIALPYINSGDTIIDVGCFTQELRKYLPSSCHYLGIDQKAYHKSNHLCDLNDPAKFQSHLCTLEVYGLKIGFLLETLEHLLYPSEILSSLAQTCDYLVVSLPNEATLFHRLRCLVGTVDAECFSSTGKHLHLPSLHQCQSFFDTHHLELLSVQYYIAPSGCGSRNPLVGRVLSLLPDTFHQTLADLCPSLFARGFIWLLKSPCGEKAHTSHTSKEIESPLVF